MVLFDSVQSLLKYGLMIIGMATVLFFVLAYGWDGEPPEISLSAEQT
ncbi:hypothetical protein K0C01_09915 [Salinarchaeum sp. IM2453]|nr:hypothetical protein [Salinarchaeum sp. IM2453]QZA88105.1 hypothetical protein K0C01_09915 [Salinarchaeum sp. IM2453]